MKFQRSTLILVGVALLLGAGVLIAESQRSQSPPPSTETATETAPTGPILPFEEGDVATLVVERDGETLTFERDGEGNWRMVEPESALAEPGAVAFLLSRLNTDSPLQTATMTADQAADFGLDAPQGTARLTLADGTEHELVLGGPDFSGSANYALLDPDPWPLAADTEYTVLVVSRDVANGINRPRSEWLMPFETLEEGSDNGSGDSNASPTESDTLQTPPEPQGSLEPEDAPSDAPEPAPQPTNTPN